MKRLFTCIFFITSLFLNQTVNAQATVRTYSFSSANGTYNSITGTTSTAVGNEGRENGIPIGFNLFYGGIGFTHFCVSTNGFIKLGIGTTTFGANDNYNSLNNDPSPNPFYPLIAGFWDDNNTNTGSIFYATTGAVGSRVLTVQWGNINIGSGGVSNTLLASFQIKLFEGTNLVKIIYSNTFDNAAPVSASIGLNDQNSFLSVTPDVTATVSSTTANNNITDLTNLRGKEYTFTPRAPLCNPVTSLTVSNITSSGAVLTAPAVSGATGYRFYVSTSAAYPPSSTLTTTPTFTLTGLLPNTTYYAQAQVACSGGNGSGWYTTSFTTSCITATIPYFENFDTVVAPTLPRCVNIQDVNAGASWANSASSAAATPYSAPNCMIYNSDPGIAGNDWFYTPPITLTGGTSYRISYYFKTQSNAAIQKLEVKYGTANSAVGMTNTLVTNSNITNSAYNVLERDFTPTTSGAYFFGFHNFSDANQSALNIDDIRITTTPTCGVPTLLNVTATSATTALASWTAPTTGTVSGYQYAVTTAATPPASGTATATTSVNVTALTQGLQYYLHVRTTCASNSAWSSISFQLPCSVKQVPYYESFDTSVTAPALPKCFLIQDMNGGTTWKTNTTTPRSTPNCMLYNWSTTLPGDDWFFTPPIRLTAGLSYWLSYFTKADVSATEEKLEVKYGTANNAASMVNSLTTNVITGTTYFQVFKSFTPAATGDYYFGFHAFSDIDQYNLYVDDIRVNYSTECGPPTGVAVSLTTTTGSATWLPSTTGTINNYQYAVTSSATPPETGAITVNTASAAFSGLLPSTQYYFHVKSLCTSGLYSTWTTYAFTTPCAAVNVPYTENFSTVTIPALPTCMSKIDVNGGNTWVTDSIVTCTPTKALVYKFNATIPGDDWAFTNGINLVAGVPYEISFDFKGCSISKQERLEVKYGTPNGVAAMTNLLYYNATINNISYQSARAGFTPTSSGTYYFGFHVISAANQFNLSIDNIKVDVSTFCGKPTPPVVTLTSDTTGTIIWSRPVEGTPAGYQFAMSNNNIPPTTAPTVPDTTALFTATAGLRFFVHVRTVCANGNLSEWVTTTFTTGCVPKSIPYTENFDIVPTPYLGNCMTSQDLNGGATWKTDTYKPRSAPNSMLYRYDPILPANDWAYTPGLQLIGGIKYRLTFYYKARGYNERLLITYGGAPIADSMVGSIWDNIFNDSTAYTQGQADFTAPRSGVFYLGFKALSVANQWDLNVDDIRVDYEPGCSTPTNFTTTITSQTTATSSWSAPYNGPATGYEFNISTNATFPSSGTPLSSNSTQLTGLLEGIKYYVKIRSACGGNTFSSWLLDSFYIPCTTRTLPYVENFDGVTAPTLAQCIRVENLNSSNTWLPTAFTPKSAPNSMVYKFNSAIAANDWFYTAPLQLTGGTSYRLTFYYKGRSSNLIEKLEIKYGTANNVNAMSNLIFADTSIKTTSYQQTQNEFTPATSGVYYIGFHAFSIANQFDINVDDIRVEVTPNCSKPTNLSVSVTGNTTANATWTAAAAGAVTNYQYVVSTSNALPENGPLVSGTSASLIGLTPLQPYYLHVRTVCNNDQFSLWSTIPFTIPCQAYPLPYYENFDATALPSLPPCYTVENANGGNTWSSNELGANSFPFSAFYVADAGRNADDWMFTPTVNFTAGLSYRVSFYYKAQSTDLVEKMEVKYGIGNTALAMTNLLMVDTNINFTAFRLYTIDFIPATSGAFNIGFHAISLKNKSYLFVDDIRIERSPNCGNPVNVTLNLTTPTSGKFSWSPSVLGVPVNYEYVISTSSSNPTSVGTAIADSFVNFNGLNNFTQYYLYVRTVCTNGISIWVSKPFYTLPNDSACTALPLTLNGAASCGNTSNATAINDPALPSNCNTANPNFTVWYKYTPTINGKVYLKAEIPVSTTPLYGSVGWYTLSGNCNSANSFTIMPGSICQEFGQSGTGDVDILASPTLTAGTTYYIMISGIDFNSGDYCLSLLATPPPSCTNNVYPTNQAQIDPVPGPNNDINFRWRKATGATGGYDLIIDSVYPPTAFKINVTDTFYKFTGINYNRTYYWYVVPKDNLGNSSGCLNNYTTFTTYNASNCRPLTNYGCSAGDSISYFSLKGELGTNIRNNTGNICGQDLFLGYSDYINSASATIEPGSGYTGFIKTGVANNYVSIWIDFDNNGYFEPSERLLNNFKAGSTRTLYSIFIPQNAPTGDRRLRIRNIYSDTKPTSPTDPCNYYDYSETEDYRVTIARTSPVPRSVANGSMGSCETIASTTIDAASNNINTSVPLLDSSNNLVAVIIPDGNSLGRVNGNLYIHSGTIRKNNGAYYLNRNISIKPEIQPITPYRFWMYYWAAELNALAAEPGAGVTNEFDLQMTKTKQDSCSSGIANYQATDSSIIPSGYGTQGDQGNLTRFIVVTNLTSFSTFYLNGKHTYRFTGNGNWSNAANWENQIIPPAILPQKDVIIIDNSIGGQCILDITQRITALGNIIVNSGKKFVVPGEIKIQH